MPSFLLLLHVSRERPRPCSPDEIAAMTRSYMDWADRMRAQDRLAGGAKLTDDAGRTMRAGTDRVAVTDGPYAESKELVGGFFIIRAADYDEACSLALSCPHLSYGGGVEVRQIQQM